MMDNNNNRLALFQERLATEWYYRGMKQEDYARMNTKIPTATLGKKQTRKQVQMSPTERQQYKEYLDNLALLFRLLGEKKFS